MKGNNNRFAGKNSKFLSKGAKFKRRQWSKNSNKGPIRYGVGVKRSDSDDDGCTNLNIIPDIAGKYIFFFIKSPLKHQ